MMGSRQLLRSDFKTQSGHACCWKMDIDRCISPNFLEKGGTPVRLLRPYDCLRVSSLTSECVCTHHQSRFRWSRLFSTLIPETTDLFIPKKKTLLANALFDRTDNRFGDSQLTFMCVTAHHGQRFMETRASGQRHLLRPLRSSCLVELT